MPTLLKLEYGLLLVLAVWLFSLSGFAWWWFLVLFLVPDVGMVGYVLNPRVGAVMYNVFHHFGVALACFLLGMWSGVPVLMLVGSVLLGHSAFDRILGYGLKYPDAFKHTHLGMIGQPEKSG